MNGCGPHLNIELIKVNFSSKRHQVPLILFYLYHHIIIINDDESSLDSTKFKPIYDHLRYSSLRFIGSFSFLPTEIA